MAERWLSITEAAARFGGSKMRVYRRIWSGDLRAANEALKGEKPRYKIAESWIDEYFTKREIEIPTRRLA
jgi:hypothetical protein